VQEYNGRDVYSEILVRWPQENRAEIGWLADLSLPVDRSWHTATDADLCRLYAAFRVTSILLLRFQSGRADGTGYPGPSITPEGFQLFHEAIGFQTVHRCDFHPFFHEIVGVDQAANPDASVAIERQIWPSLMLGTMMFCRGAVVVSAGISHIVKDIAETSKLYWTYRRKDRPCADESHGWGSNSQWRTRFRRDYMLPDGFYYNVDGVESLNRATATVDGIDQAAMIELVRHRAMIRIAIDDSDLYPYLYSYFEAVGSGDH
jgi:hypothetical protein